MKDVRAEWLALDNPRRAPDLRTLDLDPAWLDQRVEHRSQTWRVAGIHPKDWGYGRPARVTLMTEDGSTCTIGRTLLRKLIDAKNKPTNRSPPS